MTENKGGGRDWAIKILWSALMVTGGALLANYTSGSISKAEIAILLEKANETHGRFAAIDTDHEGRIRILEKTLTEMGGDVKEIRNILSNRR